MFRRCEEIGALKRDKEINLSQDVSVTLDAMRTNFERVFLKMYVRFIEYTISSRIDRL